MDDAPASVCWCVKSALCIANLQRALMGSHSEFENCTLATELEELTSDFPLFPCMHEDAYIQAGEFGRSLSAFTFMGEYPSKCLRHD